MTNEAMPATPPTPLHSSAPDSQANACLGLVGITGTGKTSLAVTGIEEAWEIYRKITLVYATDLGGWGNKMASMFKLGIARVWYMRNHVNPFETMELASLGAWPARFLDPMTGLAAPDAPLVLPYQTKWQLVCPNGHPLLPAYAEQAQIMAVTLTCPTCGQPTTAQNAVAVQKLVVRSKGFKDIGHRIYDSFTQANEWGMTALKDKSARGELAANSPLVGADAFREGSVTFGTSTRSQFGFMQDRTPVWIANIRSIPEQVLPPILTFGVELSKGDDESGGMPIFGPKISGNARTSSVPGWLGNCLYVAKEPHNPPELDEHGMVQMYHRLWLTNHVDSRDQRAIPIVAKHRGEPFGMPPYLEDPSDPAKAWSVCSLRVFYGLLRAQRELIEARDRAKYPDAPGIAHEHDAEDQEDVITTSVVESGTAGSGAAGGLAPAPGRVLRRSRRPGAGAMPTRAEVAQVEESEAAGIGTGIIDEVTEAVTTVPATPAPSTETPAAAGTASGGPEGAGATSPAVSSTVTSPPVASAPATTQTATAAPSAVSRRIRRPGAAGAAPAQPPVPMPIAEQLQASLAAQQPVAADRPVASPPVAVAPPAPMASSAAPAMAAAPGPINRIRRIPRPQVS